MKTYLDIIEEVKALSIATVDEDGHPQVRIIDTEVKDGSLYFVSSRGKNFYRELERTGEISVTCLTKDWLMLRFSGKVKKLSQDYLGMIFEASPSLNDVYPGKSRLILDVFTIYAGEGEVFSLAGHPITREPFSFGGEKVKEKGFHITERCIACGLCAANCPQKCIDGGMPFVINQIHCLHCGLCAENCPVEAIERLG